jgi:DNA-binding NtrC family response regulator
MITGDSSLDQATLCIEKGAFDYVLKPFNLKYLGKIVGHAAEKSDLSRKLAITQARVEKSISTVDKISPSSLPKMRQLKTVLEEAAELAFASLQDKDFSRNHFLVRAALRELERNLIIKTLAKLDWNQSETADFLGTSRSTLVRKMRLFKIPTAKQPTNFK